MKKFIVQPIYIELYESCLWFTRGVCDILFSVMDVDMMDMSVNVGYWIPYYATLIIKVYALSKMLWQLLDHREILFKYLWLSQDEL